MTTLADRAPSGLFDGLSTELVTADDLRDDDFLEIRDILAGAPELSWDRAGELALRVTRAVVDDLRTNLSETEQELEDATGPRQEAAARARDLRETVKALRKELDLRGGPRRERRPA